MPTPSWTVSFTMPTASNSPAKACAGHEANRTRRLDHHHRRGHKSIGQRGSRPGRHHSVPVGDIIQESRATSSRYTRATSSESALPDTVSSIELAERILALAKSADEIEPDVVFAQVNEDRDVAQFPLIKDITIIE